MIHDRYRIRPSLAFLTPELPCIRQVGIPRTAHFSQGVPLLRVVIPHFFFHFGQLDGIRKPKPVSSPWCAMKETWR